MYIAYCILYTQEENVYLQAYKPAGTFTGTDAQMHRYTAVGSFIHKYMHRYINRYIFRYIG